MFMPPDGFFQQTIGQAKDETAIAIAECDQDDAEIKRLQALVDEKRCRTADMSCFIAFAPERFKKEGDA
jgi:hypothetical protein